MDSSRAGDCRCAVCGTCARDHGGWKHEWQEREMKPTVGRIVHYVSYGSPKGPDGEQVYPSKCRAAIVTDAYGAGIAALAVLSPNGMHFDQHVVHAEPEPLIGGTWHWTEQDYVDNQAEVEKRFFNG